MTFDAILMALCVVLGLVSIDLGNIKMSFEDLPIIVGALLFGPLDGFLIGTLGTFLNQMIRYGFSATTVLWILPLTLCGLTAGWMMKKADFAPKRKTLLAIILMACIVVTAFNTLAIFVDSRMYGYYTPAFIIAPLLPRFGISVVKAIVYWAFMPALLEALRKFVGKKTEKV